jgi:glycosyltransferase involved in cell wall biosynthesis
LGIPKDAFVTIFVGQHTARKGTLRLDAALKQLNDTDIKSIYIGRGPEDPDYEGIITKGPKPHEQLPEYLSAADVFVLPTHNEGCCNAVIEALACGLPVISSDRPFNYDVLNNSNSILIDPDNVDAIATAIKKVKDDNELREKLSEEALVTANNLTLDKRVDKLLAFINNSLVL